MAEQVEKGLTQETAEPTRADVSEDLEAAADGFVSRVVAGLKRHFGGDGEAPGSSPGQALEKAVGKADETLGGAVRALREKKDWTIVEAAAKMSGPGSRDDTAPVSTSLCVSFFAHPCLIFSTIPPNPPLHVDPL